MRLHHRRLELDCRVCSDYAESSDRSSTFSDAALLNTDEADPELFGYAIDVQQDHLLTDILGSISPLVQVNPNPLGPIIKPISDLYGILSEVYCTSEVMTATETRPPTTARYNPPCQVNFGASNSENVFVFDGGVVSARLPLIGGQAASEPAQTSQNLQRLRKRKAETEAENSRLLETTRNLRAELLRMDDILEDSLEKTEHFPELSRKLNDLSDMVASMSRKLT